MFVFVQAINIPSAFADQVQMQQILHNIGRINHISFHEGYEDGYWNAVVHLETNTAFKLRNVTIFGDVSITLDLIPEKFVKTMIGDNVETHINTPSLQNVGVHIWDI